VTPLVRAVARLVLVPALLVALAILVKGYRETGDGFAAGVVAALALVLQYLAFGYREAERALPGRLAGPVAFSGLALALLVAFVPLLRGDAPLTHSPAPGEPVVHLGTLELLTAVAFDAGVFLLVVGVSVSMVRAFARPIGRGEPT
jgi:multisubunit Na+/H+ antiporter MnhB subunit